MTRKPAHDARSLSYIKFRYLHPDQAKANLRFKYTGHGATSLLFLLRLLLKIKFVYKYKNHMMRNRRRIMIWNVIYLH